MNAAWLWVAVALQIGVTEGDKTSGLAGGKETKALASRATDGKSSAERRGQSLPPGLDVKKASAEILAAGATAPPKERVLTIQEALDSTRRNNINWKSMQEALNIADAGVWMAWSLFSPRLQAEGQWMHLGERHVPEFDTGLDEAFAQSAYVDAFLFEEWGANHPDRFGDADNWCSQNPGAAFCVCIPDFGSQECQDFRASAGGNNGNGDGQGDNVFDSFVPPEDKFSATMSLVLPLIPTAVPALMGAYDRRDSATETIAHGREQLLFAVAKAYYGLVTMQSMLEVTERSIAAAQGHFKSTEIKASLRAATRLDVRRAELEVMKAESQKAEMVAGFAKAKANFGYLTGVEGPFRVADPRLELSHLEETVDYWRDLARRQRRDLKAARIDVNAAEHEYQGTWARYLPTLSLVGSVTADNAPEQRFDTDPWSWVILGTLSLDIWDGGMREADLAIKGASVRQSRYTAEDLEKQVETGVTTALRGLDDATSSRRLAERQLEVALDTQRLIKVSEKAGAVTGLEVIDVNTAAFASEANLLSARLKEAMAFLDLLAAAGQSVPFGQ